MHEFEATMEEIHMFLTAYEKRTVIIGVDANAKLNGTVDHQHVGAQIPRARLVALDRDRAKAVHGFVADTTLSQQTLG